MVIYIEIKIADSDGKILHTFENRVDEKDVKPEEPVNNRIDRDFERFLGEYLSFGGFALREKLIGDYYANTISQDNSGVMAYTDISDEIITDENLNNSELEYRIRIGDNKVLIGKVPLRLDMLSGKAKATGNKSHAAISPEADPSLDADNNENVISYEVKPSISCSSRTGQKACNSSDIKEASSKNEDAALDIIINYAMLKAIEKYEANLYPASEEADSMDMEPSFSE
jgi:hypothetical protein